MVFVNVALMNLISYFFKVRERKTERKRERKIFFDFNLKISYKFFQFHNVFYNFV